MTEPMILVAGFFLLYLVAIIYMRLDLSITLDLNVKIYFYLITFYPSPCEYDGTWSTHGNSSSLLPLQPSNEPIR
jgi:hypothetical protein